jgi:hypothetical protein
MCFGPFGLLRRFPFGLRCGIGRGWRMTGGPQPAAAYRNGRAAQTANMRMPRASGAPGWIATGRNDGPMARQRPDGTDDDRPQ